VSDGFRIFEVEDGAPQWPGAWPRMHPLRYLLQSKRATGRGKDPCDVQERGSD